MAMPRELFEKYALEFQDKIIETKRQLASVRAQLQGREREKRLSELTAKDLSGLDSSIPAYRSVGRMFISESLVDLKSELSKKSALAAKELTALERAASKLDDDLKDAEKNLAQLVKRVMTEQSEQSKK